MTEAERRRYYGWHRVLIEYQRLIHPQFDDAVLYFTGAQVELLRNLMQYARQPDGYVSIYGPDSYLIPTAAEWDDIQAIVADMEETLMGNPNTLFGYHDAYSEIISKVGTLPGLIALSFTVVPAGEIWVVQSIVAYNTVSAVPACYLIHQSSGVAHYLEQGLAPIAGTHTIWDGSIVLKEGNYIWVQWYGCTSGDNVYATVVGYKMVVP